MEAQRFVYYDRKKEVEEFDESKVGVKGLSDSGITSIPRMFIHPRESLSDLPKPSTTRPDSVSNIPVIDLAGINSPSERPKIVAQVKDAAKTWGFFQVVNHGIPLSDQNDTVSAIKAFFDLPVDAKAQYYRRLRGERGVMYASNADFFRAVAGSWRDTLQVRQQPEGEEEEGQVPEICRGEVLGWFSHSARVGEALMEVLSEGLGLEKGRLNDLTFAGSRTMISHCYPYCPEPDRTMGIASHTDNSVITVLMQNDIPGLQVNHDGVWVDVLPELGGLIVNIGDLFQIASNGEYKSVQHRVLANPSKEIRISVNMFFYVSKWKAGGYFGPLPELLSPQKPAIYRDFTKDEFREAISSKSTGSKRLVEKVKI